MSRTESRPFSPPTSPDQIRNVVLVGPGGAGKSMLFERLTAADGSQVRPGDQAPSTGLVAVTVPRGGLVVTLLDTPGRPDFVGEVRAGLRAADAVLFVVSAGDTVDEATRMLWRECAAVGMPRAVAVTQLELARADYDAVVADCRRVFGDAQPLYRPILQDGTVTGVLDLLRRRVRRVGPDGGSTEPEEPTGDEAADIEERRGPVLESVIEQSEDESLLERYLEGEDLDLATLREDLRAAVATARFFPIIPVHPPTGAGIEELFEVIEVGFPAPPAAGIPPVSTAAGADYGDISADPAAPLVAEVVRTTTDPYVGRLSLVRVFAGTLRGEDRLHVSGHLSWVAGHEIAGHPGHDEDDERVGQISSPLADGTAPREEAIAGELVLVTKIAHAETSDTLSDMEHPALVAAWLLPEPQLPVAVRATSPGDEDKLASALQRVVAEDVTLRMEQNPETHQLVLWTLGPAHVDDLLERLRERHHVDVEVDPVRTSLRETFVRPVDGTGRLVKQSGGHGQYAVVHLKIEPLERGAGFEFVDKVVGGAVPRHFISSVEKGCRSQVAQGVLAGYPLVDVRVTLLDGKAHSVDSSDMAFQSAGALALREAAHDSTVALLEPVDHLAVTVADDFVGPVMADLRGRRAQVHGTEAGEDGHTVVHAEVPQHELSRYAIDLRSVSHGSGTFTREFVRYDYLPPQLAKDVGGL